MTKIAVCGRFLKLLEGYLREALQEFIPEFRKRFSPLFYGLHYLLIYFTLIQFAY